MAPSTPNIGRVVADQSTTTTFSESPSGTVTVVAGGGNGGFDPPVASRTVTAQTVTISCNNQAACSGKVTVTVTAGGATGRAGAITNFTAAMGTATFVSGNTSGSSLSFVIGGIGKSSSKTFQLGMDIPISATGTSGTATATYSVTAALTTGPSTAGSASSGATAYALRYISMGWNSDLQFGHVVRPATGSSTITLNAVGGGISVTGIGAKAVGPVTPTVASFTATGEGGQAISVSVPSTITMTAGSTNLSITTNTTAAGSLTLSGGLNGVGTYTYNVGGFFTITHSTPFGTYQGTFQTTVNYN